MTRFIRLHAMAGGDAERRIESLGELPSARRLASLRYERRATPIGRTAVVLSEGGGLGLHFGMREHYAANPPADDIDAEIARLNEAILADESHHMRSRFQAASAQVADERSWGELEASLVAISAQKLRERNEQFSCPLSEEELASIPGDRALGERYTRDHLAFLVAGL